MPYRILPNQIAILMLLKSEGFQIHQVRNYCGYHQCKYIVYVFSNFRLFQLLYTMQEMIGSNFWLITVAINLFNFYSPFFAFRKNLQEDKYHWETRSKQKGKVRWTLMQQLCCSDYFMYIYPSQWLPLKAISCNVQWFHIFMFLPFSVKIYSMTEIFVQAVCALRQEGELRTKLEESVRALRNRLWSRKNVQILSHLKAFVSILCILFSTWIFPILAREYLVRFHNKRSISFK